MSRRTLLLLLACVPGACGGGDDGGAIACVGIADTCTLDGGVLGGRFCPPAGTAGSCFPLSGCNPLTQDCPQGDGYGCYQSYYGTYCSPVEEYACERGQRAFYTEDRAIVCRSYCDFAAYPYLREPGHCAEDEECGYAGQFVADGVGVCTTGL